jgi:hypothetical protein
MPCVTSPGPPVTCPRSPAPRYKGVRPRRARLILVTVEHNADGLLADPPDQLRAFIREGRIVALPAKRARRSLLLEQVAQAFEPGRQYPETAVNEILKQVWDDHCTLRRYLVEEDFLSRTPSGTYWRAGGTVH